MNANLDTLRNRAQRIADCQAVFLNDTTGRTESLALYGHDIAWHGSVAFAKACRALLQLPNHWNPNELIQTRQQVQTVINHLNKYPKQNVGLRNQVIDGLTIRAGLVIGAPVPCGTTGCTTGRIMAGEARCAGCGTSFDTHAEMRCEGCQAFLGADTAERTSRRCTACLRGHTSETSCIGSRRHRWLTRNDGTPATCIHCHRSQDAVSGSYLQAGTTETVTP